MSCTVIPKLAVPVFVVAQNAEPLQATFVPVRVFLTGQNNIG
jgi:hypothetical protein